MVLCSITLEAEHTRDGERIEAVSFYDSDHLCHGDIDITEMKIYQVRNPFFLSDTFVFCKRGDSVLYIKVNYFNQIEEIGKDFARRFHFSDYGALLQRKDVEPATALNKTLFSVIGNEYWK